jgi:GDP-fucose transporter C1
MTVPPSTTPPTASPFLFLASPAFRVVCFYWVVSMGLVFLNKYVMMASFPFPLFITWFQLVVSLVMGVALGHLGTKRAALSFIPPFDFDRPTARQVLPLTFLYVLLLSLTNVCLRHVEVSFYQLVKSLAIVFNIVVQWVVLDIASSELVLMSCGVVTLGFTLGTIGEVRFSWLGLLAGVASSAVQAFYNVHIKKALPVVQNSTWRLQNYNTALSVLILFPFVVASGEMRMVLDSPDTWEPSNWWGLAASGVVGYLINIAIFLQIKHTSPLTATVSATAKAAAQTFGAVLIYRNPISTLNLWGLCISLAGSAWYAKIKHKETTQAKEKG